MTPTTKSTIVVMPKMLHVHYVLQQLRHGLRLLGVMVFHGMTVLRSGRCRATGAARYFVSTQAGRTANYIGWQSIRALIGASTASGTILSYGLQFHAHVQTFVKTTGRTLLSCGYGNRTSSTP